MSTTPSTFYLVVYDMMLPADSIPVIKSLLHQRAAEAIINGPSVVDKKDTNDRYEISDCKKFTYNNTDGSMTMFIVCQGKKIEK